MIQPPRKAKAASGAKAIYLYSLVCLREPYEFAELARAIANSISQSNNKSGEDNLIDFQEKKRGRPIKPS